MNSKPLAAALLAAVVFLGAAVAGRATDVVWKKVVYHDAYIQSTETDRVTIVGTSDVGGSPSTFTMPLSKVPDEIIKAYRAGQKPATAERPPTAEEEAAIKAELAKRDARLANLKKALAQDPYHPVMVVGHIIVKDKDGIIILCDGSALPGVPESVGTVFLENWPGALKLGQGDPIGVIGYKAGQHIYNFQNIPSYSIHPPQAPPEGH